MTFGLGYFQDGVWVDHLAADHAGIQAAADGGDAEGDATAIDVVHEWFSCCPDPVERELPVAEPAGAVPALGVTLPPVAVTADR